MDTFTRHAFSVTLPDAEHEDTWYVCLLVDTPFYGGPEEGGWWGTDTHTVAARACFNKRAADRYARQVRALAETLSSKARDRHGDACLRSEDGAGLSVTDAINAGWIRVLASEETADA